jgi:hypothetical protein
VATTTIVIALAFWTSTDFAEVEKAAEAQVSDASLAVSERADRSLVAIDVVLESVAARLSERGLDNFGSESDRDYLTQIARRLPENGSTLYRG